MTMATLTATGFTVLNPAGTTRMKWGTLALALDLTTEAYTGEAAVANTTDGNGSFVDALPGQQRNQGLLVPFLLVIICTVVANIIVMVCTRVDKRLRSVSTLYVFSLAMADTIVGLVVMVGMLFYTMYGYWPLGSTLCTIWIGLDFTCCTVSMVHLCLIAHDRYVALVHPMQYKSQRTVRDALIRIGLSWTGSVIVWLPAIVAIRLISTNGASDIDCFFLPDRLYILLQSICIYYVPIVVMVYFYVMCLRMLRQRYVKTADATRSAEQHIVDDSQEVTLDSSVSVTKTSGVLLQASNSSEASRTVARNRMSKQQMQLRSIRTLGVVMVTFLLCWLPFCLFWPITAYCPGCIPDVAYEFSYWSAYLNSTINPLLYFLTNRDFRHALTKLNPGKRLCSTRVIEAEKAK